MVHAYGATTRFQFRKRYISGSAAKLVTTNTDLAGEKKKIKKKKRQEGENRAHCGWQTDKIPHAAAQPKRKNTTRPYAEKKDLVNVGARTPSISMPSSGPPTIKME